MKHVYKCEPCDGHFRVEVPFGDLPPGSPPCPVCKKTESYKDYSANKVYTNIYGGKRSGPIDYTQTAAEIAKWNGRDIKQEHETLRRLKKEYKRTKQTGLLRHIGAIPVDEYHARRLQTENPNYWQDDMKDRGAKRVLKEHGYYLGE